MIIYKWPKDVPDKAYGIEPGYDDNVVRTESDSGIVLQYSKNTFTPKTYSFGVHMTKKQKAVFDDWYSNTLGGGSAPFYFKSLDGGEKLVSYMFSEPPSPDVNGNFVDVTMNVRESAI